MPARQATAAFDTPVRRAQTVSPSTDEKHRSFGLLLSTLSRHPTVQIAFPKAVSCGRTGFFAQAPVARRVASAWLVHLGLNRLKCIPPSTE